MARRNARFTATKTVAKPAKVKFKTKSGRTVYFKAVKTVQQRRVVRTGARPK